MIILGNKGKRMFFPTLFNCLFVNVLVYMCVCLFVKLHLIFKTHHKIILHSVCFTKAVFLCSPYGNRNHGSFRFTAWRATKLSNLEIFFPEQLIWSFGELRNVSLQLEISCDKHGVRIFCFYERSEFKKSLACRKKLEGMLL